MSANDKNNKRETFPSRPDGNNRNSVFDLVEVMQGGLIKGKHLVDSLVIRPLMTP